VKFAQPLGYLCHGPAQYRDDGHWLPPEPERPVTEADLARWRAAWPDATCSERTARTLAALLRDFGPHGGD